jgi:hypothetical protein
VERLGQACFPLHFKSLGELICVDWRRLRVCHCAYIDEHVIGKVFVIRDQCTAFFVFEADAMAFIYAIEIFDSRNDGFTCVMCIDQNTHGNACSSRSFI